MNIIFYSNFNKERESTKVPSPEIAQHTISGTLKEEVSILSPVIKIPSKNISPQFAYNYAYIPQFERYYFVQDYIYNPPFWEIYFKCDVLASHRNNIAKTNAYVLRSASTYDLSIRDTMYPATSDPVTYVDIPISSNPFTSDAQKGTYVLGVINSESTNGASVGAVTYYIMPASTLAAIKNMLLANPSWLNVNADDLSESLVKGLINPFQYVVSCKWFPFSVNVAMFPSVNTFKLGWWTWPVSSINVISSSAYYNVQIDFTVRKHPQYLRGSYLNVAPYSSYSIFIPTFGNIALNPAWCDDTNTIHCVISTDLGTGQSQLGLILDSGLLPVMVYDGCIGVDVQLAQISYNSAGVIRSVASAAGGLIGGLASLNVGGAISSAASGIASAIESAVPRVDTQGTNGCFSVFSTPSTITSQFYRIVDEDFIHLGRPCCKMFTLGGLSGYTQCAKPEYPWNDVTDSERTEILNYMSTGFYLDWGEGGGVG